MTRPRPTTTTTPARRRERLLTVEEAAERLGMATSTLRNWIALRRIEFVRVGGKLTKIAEGTVDRYIAEHTVAAVPRFYDEDPSS